MTYRSLSPELHSTADAAKTFCRSHWGISATRVRDELPVIKDIGFVTTLHAVMSDHHWLCIEVAENPYPPTFDAFILDCKNRVLPVKLYVAAPPLAAESFRYELRRARTNGVGLIEVANGTAALIQSALSLSLTGVRVARAGDFPLKYRQPISEANETFVNGNPAKACAVLYEEIENLSRRIGNKARRNNLWNTSMGGAPPSGDFEKMPWASLLPILRDRLDQVKCGCTALNVSLWGRLIGATGHRNESAHKPGSRAALMKRDAQLRTRFESGVDLLRDFLDASRPLRL